MSWADECENPKVLIDVGGCVFATTVQTLQKSPFFEHGIPSFVDRDPVSFTYILNYLRNDAIFLGNEDPGFLQLLKTEADFYKLYDMKKQIESYEGGKKNEMTVLIEELKHIKQAMTHKYALRNRE